MITNMTYHNINIDLAGTMATETTWYIMIMNDIVR